MRPVESFFTSLPPNVQCAFHAVAIHENRKLFNVTLFEPNQVTNLKEVSAQNLIDLQHSHLFYQIWFSGSHSDVGGGGYSQTDLTDVSLLWMIVSFPHLTLHLDLNSLFRERSKQ
jgi:hypothetical protein